MTIWINDIAFSKVTELSALRELRRTDIRYNTQGDMLIDLVNRKYRLTVRFGLLTGKELKLLRGLTKEIFVTVKFPAPEADPETGLETGEFHISDEPAPTVTVVNGVTMYGGVELIMQQK
ncbi:MAG: hypothetical protein ACI4WS_11600 [Oscillospiraceae bacterium]